MAAMAELITIPYAAEGGHFYDPRTGAPAYTVKGKNGKERNTTLSDARKLGLVPGVSTITNEAAKPGLENWKLTQRMLASLTLPRIEGESDAEWITRIVADSQQEGQQAADRGTQIHAWLQQYFEGIVTPDEAAPYCAVVEQALMKEALVVNPADWQIERSFCDPTGRYGGKVDLYRLSVDGVKDYAVLDIKTKATPDKFKLYDDHFKQLAAYSVGLGCPLAPCGIIFVSIEPITAEVRWIEDRDLNRGWRMFRALLDHWYARTGLEVNHD
jgi:hypothetical protein